MSKVSCININDYKRQRKRLLALFFVTTLLAILVTNRATVALPGAAKSAGGTVISEEDIDAMRIAGIRIASEFTNTSGSPIQTALDDFNDNPGTVYIPAGHYYPTAPIQLKPKQRLIGEGIGTVIHGQQIASKVHNNYEIITGAPGYDSHFSFCSVENLMLEGGNGLTPWGSLLIWGYGHFTVKNVWIENQTQYAVQVLGTTYNVLFDHVRVDGNYATGTSGFYFGYIGPANYPGLITMRNIHIVNCQGWGIVAYGTINGLSIETIEIGSFSDSYWMTQAITMRSVTWFTIKNAYIGEYGFIEDAVKIDGCTYGTIQDSVIASSNKSGLLITNTTAVPHSINIKTTSFVWNFRDGNTTWRHIYIDNTEAYEISVENCHSDNQQKLLGGDGAYKVIMFSDNTLKLPVIARPSITGWSSYPEMYDGRTWINEDTGLVEYYWNGTIYYANGTAVP